MNITPIIMTRSQLRFQVQPQKAIGPLLLMLFCLMVKTGCSDDVVVSTESELEQPDPRIHEIRDMMSYLDAAPDVAVLLIGEMSKATTRHAEKEGVMKDGTPYYLVTDLSEVQALSGTKLRSTLKGALKTAGIERDECTIRTDTPKNFWNSGKWVRFGLCVLDLFDGECEGKIKGLKDVRDGVEYYVVTCLRCSDEEIMNNEC